MSRKGAQGALAEPRRVALEFGLVEVRKRAPRILEVADEAADSPVRLAEGDAALHEVLCKVGRARKTLVGGL